MGSGVAASFAGSGAEFLITLHAALPWQFPWQSMVPLCLSFIIHKAGGEHIALLYLTKVLYYAWFAHD